MSLTVAIVFVETEMESLGQEALQKLDTDELERLCKVHGLTKKSGESKESITRKRAHIHTYIYYRARNYTFYRARN